MVCVTATKISFGKGVRRHPATLSHSTSRSACQ